MKTLRRKAKSAKSAVEIFKSNKDSNTTAGYIKDKPAVWSGYNCEPSGDDEVVMLDDGDSFVCDQGFSYVVRDDEFLAGVKVEKRPIKAIDSEDAIKDLKQGQWFRISGQHGSMARFVGVTTAGVVWTCKALRYSKDAFEKMCGRFADLMAKAKAKLKAAANKIKLQVVPISLKVAKAFVDDKHRHHQAPQGHKFSIGVQDQDGNLRGVVIVGRPVARALDDGLTAEATRVCTDGTRNACSMLYSAAWKAARGMGYLQMVTYTLESESGGSLRASNFHPVAKTKGRSWNCKSRKRTDKHPTEDKIRWQIGSNAKDSAIEI